MSQRQQSLQVYFHDQYDRYGDAIFRFCLFKVSNREKALDITQETFMRLWDTIRTEGEMTYPRAFLYKTARNLIIDWYRKKKDRSLDALTEAGFAPADDTHERMEAAADAKFALKIIQQLETDDRELLIMRYVDDLSPKDIAVILNVSANVVSVRINRAVAKARTHLTKYE